MLCIPFCQTDIYILTRVAQLVERATFMYRQRQCMQSRGRGFDYHLGKNAPFFFSHNHRVFLVCSACIGPSVLCCWHAAAHSKRHAHCKSPTYQPLVIVAVLCGERPLNTAPALLFLRHHFRQWLWYRKCATWRQRWTRLLWNTERLVVRRLVVRRLGQRLVVRRQWVSRV